MYIDCIKLFVTASIFKKVILVHFFALVGLLFAYLRPQGLGTCSEKGNDLVRSLEQVSRGAAQGAGIFSPEKRRLRVDLYLEISLIEK